MLVADTRWSGQNGIGRYAKEVLARLTVDWSPMPAGGSPSSPTDFLLKRLSTGRGKPTGIYSPGYNGFLRPVPQTLTVLDLIHLQGPDSRKYRGYYDFFLKPLIKRNGHVITISETSRDAIREWVATDSVEVINAGMGSTAAFTREGPAHQAERPYIIYVGNLRPHKNVRTLVEAISRTSDIDLVLVTQDADRVRELAAEFSVEDRVRLVGSTSDEELAELYRGARAAVQPSTLEGFGLPALEAALCGTPVLFAEVCGSVREICSGAGRAIGDALDPQEWASSIASVAEGERFPDGIVTAEQYDWDMVGNTVDETIRRFQPEATFSSGGTK